MHVDTVGERSGDARRVSIHITRRAIARARRISRLTAWAGIRCPDECETRWIRHCLRGPRNHHFRVLHWLPQAIEDVTRKLQHLIQEKHSVVREAHLSGSRNGAASNQTRARDSVVRRSERTYASADAGMIQNTGNGMDGDDLERFFLAECGKNARHAAREHRLSRAWRANQQDVVPPSGSDLQRALRSRLSDDVGEIGSIG
jgi:hypothetical protein